MKNNVVALLFLAGCSSGPNTPTQLFHSEVDAACALYVRCGTIGKAEQSSCQSNGYKFYDTYLTEQSDYDLNAAVAARRLAVNGSAASTCLSAYGSLSCNTSVLDAQTTAACAQVYTGLVALGGTCEQSIECASGYCQQNAGSATCTGVCTTFIAEGGSCPTDMGCDTTKDFCGTDETHTDLTCLALPQSGEPCPLGQCAVGLLCSNQTCTAPGTAGSACMPGTCGSGLYCPSTGQSCQPLVKSGQVCTDEGSCEDGTICNSFGKPTGTCAPLLDVGAACDPTAPACAQDDVCDETKHVCVLSPLVLTEGSACTPGGGECTGSLYSVPMYCDSTTSVCTDKVGEGTACDPAAVEGKCLYLCDSDTKICNGPIDECI